MNLNLYDMISGALLSFTEEHSFTESDLEMYQTFYRKNKIRFNHKKCNERPFFELKRSVNDIEYYDDHRPLILHHVYDDKTKKLVDSSKIVIPLEWIDIKLDQMHKVNQNTPSESCKPMGVKALFKAFNEMYFFKGIYNVVTKYLANCKTCAQNKPISSTNPPPPVPIRSFRPFERVQFDLIDIATNSRIHLRANPWGYRYILVIKDCFSKFCWLYPLQKKEAPLVYNAASFLFQMEGYPLIFQSDNGKEFVAEIISTFLKENGIAIKHGKPYHPQSQGQVENLNKRVKTILSRYLQKLSQEEQSQTWPIYLPAIASAINNTWHSTIDDIPFRVYKQRDPSTIISTIVPDDNIWLASDGDYGGNDDGDNNNDNGDDSDDNTNTNEDHHYLSSIPSLSETDIYQICSSSSLTPKVLRSKEEKPEIRINTMSSCIADEEEFQLKSFNYSLYAMGKKQQTCHLSALESTEYVIHRNIKYRYSLSFLSTILLLSGNI